MNAPLQAYRGLLLLVLVTAMAACEEDVAAPSAMGEPFSMYGVLNPCRNVQTIAVAPIEPILSDYPRSIDAVVTSTELHTGEIVTWKDSVVTGERGQIDHVFWAELTPVRGHDYLVEVSRSDGATASALASVPDHVVVTYENNPPQFLDVYVNGEEFRLVEIDVEYIVHGYNIFTPSPCRNPQRDLVLSYTNREKPTDSGYHIRIDPGLDHARLVEKYKINWIVGFQGLALTAMRVRLLVGDPVWAPPGGEFDERVLGAASTMTNVMNGFGLVTGGYEHQRRVYPSAELIEPTYFFDFMLRPPGDCLDYCACRQ